MAHDRTDSGLTGAGQDADQRNRHHLRAVALEDLPELAAFLEDTAFKQSILEHTGGGAAFIEQATPVIERALMGATSDPFADNKRTPLSRLLRRGYSHKEIAHAFAETWLHESDTLYLAQHRVRDSGLVIYGFPLLILMTISTFGLIHIFDAHPRWVASFVYLAPLLLMPYGLIFWVFVTIWRGLLQRL